MYFQHNDHYAYILSLETPDNKNRATSVGRQYDLQYDPGRLLESCWNYSFIAELSSELGWMELRALLSIMISCFFKVGKAVIMISK